MEDPEGVTDRGDTTAGRSLRSVTRGDVTVPGMITGAGSLRPGSSGTAREDQESWLPLFFGLLSRQFCTGTNHPNQFRIVQTSQTRQTQTASTPPELGYWHFGFGHGRNWDIGSA